MSDDLRRDMFVAWSDDLSELRRVTAVLQAIHARGPVTCDADALDCGHAGCRAMAETWAEVDAALRGDGQ